MPKTELLENLRLPVVVAPMFLVSGPELVIESSKAGLIGSFPGPNARTTEDLDNWMKQISNELNGLPWAYNMITHKSYDRFVDELNLVNKYKPKIVITALGSPERVIEKVQSYGGLVIADVNSVDFAYKCASMGVDGLALVCHGAGGHTGTLSPFAFTSYVREFYKGLIVLSGCISNGSHIKASITLGADLCYMGTRFIPCNESLASDENKSMILNSSYNDLRLSNLFTGADAYYLKDSIKKYNLDPDNLEKNEKGFDLSSSSEKISAWKHLWSAGQGVGFSKELTSVRKITEELEKEFLSS